MATLSLSIQGQDQIVNISTLIDALLANENLTITERTIIDHLESSDHPKRGDIQVELTSPQGTVSVLLPNRD